MLSRILPFLGRKTENNSRGSSENKTENSGVMDYTETPENDDFRDRECDCFLGWKKKGYRKWHGSRNSAPRGKSISPVYPSIGHTQTRSMSVLLKKVYTLSPLKHWTLRSVASQQKPAATKAPASITGSRRNGSFMSTSTLLSFLWGFVETFLSKNAEAYQSGEVFNKSLQPVVLYTWMDVNSAQTDLQKPRTLLQKSPV